MNKKKCANCGKEIDLDNKESFKICMHNQMHSYVCDSKCMLEFYGYKNTKGVANNQFELTQDKPSQGNGMLDGHYAGNNKSFSDFVLKGE